MEQVAYFLRRIDAHLDRIAYALQSIDGAKKIRHSLQSFENERSSLLLHAK